jgi:hypothetical protein
MQAAESEFPAAEEIGSGLQIPDFGNLTNRLPAELDRVAEPKAVICDG